MKIAKVFTKGLGHPAKFFCVEKIGTVQFDSRSGWMLVRDAAKRVTDLSAEFFWMHPSDTPVEWIREFKDVT